MRAVVVYESMFGDNAQVATAVAEGLRASGVAAEAVEVGHAPTAVEGVDLLVVGAPNHAWSLPRPSTRADAASKADGPVVSEGIGVREWLETMEGGSPRVAAAAFDTRIKGPALLWGSAARGADKLLRQRGCQVIAGPRSFLVEGPTGPVVDRLVDGELERARSWGASLATAIAEPASGG